MNKGAVFYILRVLVQRLLGLGLFLLGSGGTLGPRGAVYFALYLAIAAAANVILYRVNPVTLAERGKAVTDSPLWDKVLLGLYWLLSFFVIYLIAGWESRAAPAPGTLFLVGVFLQLPVSALTVWAMAVNTFLESTARIQADRGQTVCRAGPYQFIRHPAYAAVLLWCVSVCLVFQTPLTALAAALMAVIIVVRTYLEDRMLQKDLAGYEAYARDVRYRLVPYVW